MINSEAGGTLENICKIYYETAESNGNNLGVAYIEFYMCDSFGVLTSTTPIVPIPKSEYTNYIMQSGHTLDCSTYGLYILT